MAPAPDFYANTTPFPNYLLNDVMPALKDTEWRLLCVVVRQTRGWKDARTGTRKTSDWLTRAQLMRKTGRNSEALSHALDSLVQQNLLEVRHESGRLLHTPSARRQVRGRIYYALHALLIQKIAGADRAAHQPTKSEPANIEPVKASNPATYSVFESEERKSEQRRVGKPNGTKENTKQTETKSVVSGERSEQRPDEGRERNDSLWLEEKLWDLSDTKALPDSIQAFTRLYLERYSKRFPDAAPPVAFTSALCRLEAVLHQYPRRELANLLDLFFRCNLAHIERQHYSLESFVHNINVLQELMP